MNSRSEPSDMAPTRLAVVSEPTLSPSSSTRVTPSTTETSSVTSAVRSMSRWSSPPAGSMKFGAG
ncbi:MAG: hypothetical protein IPN32_37035 [Deltaproteobacteria bacterium]|nr:hypothetical protein [Deltaproteobacteria bacterium]